MEIELLEPVNITGPQVVTKASQDVRICVPDPIKVRVTSDMWAVDLEVRPHPITLDPSLAGKLVIEQRGDVPIPLDILRSLRMGRVLEAIVTQFSIRYVRKGSRWVAELVDPEPPSRDELRKVLTSRRTKDTMQAEIEKAAVVYQAARDEGRRDPTMAVAEALNMSRPTAARRVQRAREQKLLAK